ncbi:MAG TPA: glycerol-3-phosphate acyltransferase, partial [Trueperaceae bacterium]|nr:glycerol-3-phosphate acyltransferase [Trueperaceae bacterium]
MIQAILAVLSAYLIAALPTAYILAKLQGKNIFELGSGNMGAMNTFRNLGIAAGIAVLIIDIAKGYLAVKLAQIIATNNINIGYFAAIAVVLGHAWSIYVGFRGGKALSSSFGTLLALDPKGALVVLFAIIIFSLAIKKNPNFAAVIAMLS